MNDDMPKQFDVARELGLDPNKATFEVDNLKLNLQMMLYVVMGLVKKDESLVNDIRQLQEEFVERVKNEKVKGSKVE